MQVRRSRLLVLALLIVAGAAAALLTWDVHRRATELAAAARGADERSEQLLATAAAILAAQQAYVAPGQPDGQWLARVSTLLQQFTGDVAAARPRARSTEARAALNAVAEGTGTLVEIDGRVREHLAAGQDLIAADLIFADSRQAIDGVTGQLRRMRDAERAAVAGEQAALARQGWLVLGGAALLWLGGLVVLLRVPAAPVLPAAVVPRPQADSAGAPKPMLEAPVDLSLDAPPAPAPAARTPLDLAAAADVCTAISRMTASAELPDLLGRAAAVLDAAGVIIWMSAGEELFAVTAHGYDPRVISRLGPIGRNADNATAACWRSGELKTFAGDIISNGAIVAPMFGPDTCVGVLAAEVRHGREGDAGARAVAAMFAAQLATVVAAWPAASAAGDVGTTAAAIGS